MSRRIRRAPLTERIANYFDPRDWALWLSEELQTSDWAQVQGKPTWLIGLGINLLFMTALSNSNGGSASDDDVFGDYTARNGSGWLGAFCRLAVFWMCVASLINTFYVFASTRKYRLFERSLDELPKTPSARRVRVDESPLAAAASPLKYVKDKLSWGNSAEQRAHPVETRDVVELSVWDPPPICLRLFTLFSPAHIIVYWSFLPTAPSDPMPSVTVARTILLAALVTAQGFALEKFFMQQVQDKLILSREVLNEYDTKYVHPTINRPARDVAIQTPPRRSRKSEESAEHKEIGTDPMPDTPEVQVSREYTIINRGFKTNPNPVYASHYDKDNYLGLQSGSAVSTRSHNAPTPVFRTPATHGWASSYTSTGATQTNYGEDMSSPLRVPETLAPTGFSSMPRHQPTYSRTGDGGSFGVYTSAASPLRKAASHQNMRPETAAEQLRKREGSPLKRMSLPAQEDQLKQETGTAALNTRLRDLRGETGPKGRRQSGRF
ncbi:uncharacterized protein PV09_03054 [Verruconis gallopava]|uniref:Nuclear rim protein 1 n=1 Tax=Verruconis gallopava TaxID=253628 RepID=A0A0D2AH05_9PEZI|nr:uncharacterized protein PV09_03054 [Verruconis gallopava]KIW05850.1 hypothetical protein PV09_03054 [Verruconis gallopava]